MNQLKREGHLQNAIALDAHQYELNISEPPALLEPGDLLKVSGKIKNISGRDWDIFVGDREIIKIGIQVYEENKPWRQEFRRSLGVDKFVDGATIEFECVIDTKPLKQGKIKLVFDLVAECYYWFEDKGAKPETITVQVLPRTAGNLIKIGNQLKREGKLAEAIAEYWRAIELNPNFSWAYFNLGDALFKRGYINEAIEKYKKAIELNELNSNSCFLLYIETALSTKKNIYLQQYERKVYSQNWEDGVIEKIFEVIKTTNKYYVEFGVENANECNTRNLRENCGWTGLLMDGGYENKEIGLYQEFITAENINELFRKYNVPQEFDLLSIDIDYNDFYIWKNLDEIYQPRVVIIEYNASHLPTEDKVVKYDPNAVWDTTNYFGASIRALYNLGKRKGYSLIYAENQGVNLFFVKSSLLSKIEYSFKDTDNVFLIYNSPQYGSELNVGHRLDDKNREYITSEEILST